LQGEETDVIAGSIFLGEHQTKIEESESEETRFVSTGAENFSAQ